MSESNTELDWQTSLRIARLQKEGMSDKKIAKLLEATLYAVKRIRSQTKRKDTLWKKHGKYSGNPDGIDYTRKDVNVVRMHNNKETWKHYLTKCIIVKLLVDSGHAVVSEAVAPSGVIDVYDIDKLVAYEAETNLSPQKKKDKTFQYLQEGVVEEVIIFGLKDFDIEKPIGGWIDVIKYRCLL